MIRPASLNPTALPSTCDPPVVFAQLMTWARDRVSWGAVRLACARGDRGTVDRGAFLKLAARDFREAAAFIDRAGIALDAAALVERALEKHGGTQ